MFKAVIFDMDGLLIDSEPLWERAETEVFSALGVQITPELKKQTAHRTTDEVTAFYFNLFPWQGPSQAEVEQRVIDRVIELVEAEGKALPGVFALLTALQDRNIPFALATNSTREIMQRTLKHLDVIHLFAHLCCADDVAKGKPEPDIYLLAADKLGMSPTACLVFEDSVTGMTAGHKAGMAVTVVPGRQDLDDPRFDIAQYKLKSLEDVDLSLFSA